jgi:hypothetical protein
LGSVRARTATIVATITAGTTAVSVERHQDRADQLAHLLAGPNAELVPPDPLGREPHQNCPISGWLAGQEPCMLTILAQSLAVVIMFATVWTVIHVRERHAGDIDAVLISAVAICVMVGVLATMARSLDHGLDQIVQLSQLTTAR